MKAARTDATNISSSTSSALALAEQVLRIEAEAVHALIGRLDHTFVAAVELILACGKSHGRVIVSGIGKSGHIARKIASTMSSTGTPAYFVHPAEASHGDLGMITENDILIALSNSGESAELLAVAPLIKRQGAKLIAITGKADSTLAKLADVHLDAGVSEEACPLNLAPTASTTAALALGDALAVALLDAKGFSATDFARSHPGGSLGRKLLTHVHDVMHTGPEIPLVTTDANVADAILEMTAKHLGMTAVVDRNGKLAGIFTDGDLRRALERHNDIKTLPVRQVMTSAPKTIGADALAAEAVHLMETWKIGQLVVVDAGLRPVGALNLNDLFRAKVL